MSKKYVPQSHSSNLQYDQLCCEYGVAEEDLAGQGNDANNRFNFGLFLGITIFTISASTALFLIGGDAVSIGLFFALCSLLITFTVLRISAKRVAFGPSAYSVSDKNRKIHLHATWDKHWYDTHCGGNVAFHVRLWGWERFHRVKGVAWPENFGGVWRPRIDLLFQGARSKEWLIQFPVHGGSVECDLRSSRDHELINRFRNLEDIKNAALGTAKATASRDTAVGALCDIVAKCKANYDAGKRSPHDQKTREIATSGIYNILATNPELAEAIPRINEVLELPFSSKDRGRGILIKC